MKKLVYIIIIVSLPIICFFQYKNWTKFSAPNQYDYVASKEIDVNYFDLETVKAYFKNVQEIGSFARSTWYTHDIDVRNYDQNDPQATSKATYYDQLIAQTKYYENLLVQSNTLKKKGYNNIQIQEMIEKGVGETDFNKEKIITEILNIKFGDINQAVYLLQKQLSEKGYANPHDGNFKSSTLEMLVKFQSDNDLAPTGIVDKETAIKIMQ